MVDDWIKWCKGLTRKAEVGSLARRLRMSRREMAGCLMELWEWCDENLGEDNFSGQDATVLIHDPKAYFDELLGIPGFSDAISGPDVAWMEFPGGDVAKFLRVGLHNGKTAKERAVEQRRKQKQRREQRSASDLSGSCPGFVPKKAGQSWDKSGTREGEGEGEAFPFPSQENGISKVERERKENGERERAWEKNPVSENASRSIRPADQSTKEISCDEGSRPEPLEIDWSVVWHRAEAIEKRVKPKTENDRRNFLRYAVLSLTTFSEHWLLNAAEAAALSGQTKKSRQAHFVGVLKSKAAETNGISSKDFNAMARKIEIPDEIWKSDVLAVSKKSKP